MAQKRMFDRAIIDTDRFMDLSMSAKALYFLLGMEADDEGFVSYKKVMRIHGGNEDDMKILLAKNYLIAFPSGVVVITDWNNNNYLDSNRIKPTEYQREKTQLLLTDNGKYELNTCSTSIEESRGEYKQISPISEEEERVIEEVGKDIDEDGNPIKKKKVKVAQPADVRVDEIVAEWNRYSTSMVSDKKISNNTAYETLLLEAKPNPLLAKKIREKLKSIPDIEDWKHAIKKYAEDVVNRDGTDKYATHRFSLYEFVYQQNGLPRFLNR